MRASWKRWRRTTTPDRTRPSTYAPDVRTSPSTIAAARDPPEQVSAYRFPESPQHPRRQGPGGIRSFASEGSIGTGRRADHRLGTALREAPSPEVAARCPLYRHRVPDLSPRFEQHCAARKLFPDTDRRLRLLAAGRVGTLSTHRWVESAGAPQGISAEAHVRADGMRAAARDCGSPR
jgi:hypothetical protein